MRWSFKVLMVGVLASSSLLGPLSSVQADPAAEAGRAIASKWQNAIVTLQIVSKVRASMYGEESSKEMKQEVTGIVIDPSGLVVTSQIGTNVTDLYTQMADQSDSESMKTSSEITSLKVILPEGKELPGKVVLRDKDLDLAFIRLVTKPENPLSYIDLTQASKASLLDEVISISRLGTIANRTLGMQVARIHAVIEKPRMFYVPNEGELGAPVFSLDGNIIGMGMLRARPKGGSSNTLEMNGSGMSGVLEVIIPASDIVQAAKQAPSTVDAAASAPAPEKPKPAAPAKTVAPSAKNAKGGK